MLPNKLPNPLPTFLGNVSISHIHSVQLSPELQLCPILQITRPGKNCNSGTLQHILNIFLNTCYMALGFWADKLCSKSHGQKTKCGFCKVFSFFFFKKTNHYMITVMLTCSLIQHWAVLPSLPLTSKWISSAWVFENSLLWRHILAGQHKHYS